MPEAPDPRAMARAVGRAHDRFVTGVGASASSVRSLVLESWRRSTGHGVNPAGTTMDVLSDSDTADRRAATPLARLLPLISSLLVAPATQAGQVVAVGDAEGRLLWVEGARDLRRSLDAVGFTPGALWSESAVGTNAPGTALATDRPTQIVASEHFVTSVQPFSCAAVPVHDPTNGSLLGVIDVTGGDEAAAPMTLALVRATAVAAEASMSAWAVGPAPATSDTSDAAVAPLELLVLERERAVLRRPHTQTVLSPRHSDLALLLSLHPAGLRTEQIAVLLSEDEVPPVTIRAEMLRLRRVLGPDLLTSRPYRLTQPVNSDAQVVAAAADAGELSWALRNYPGPVLPRSDSPAIADFRDQLAARVQRAALACDDPVALSHFAATQTGGNDVQVLRALLRATPTDSPRRSAISARIAVLDRVYG